MLTTLDWVHGILLGIVQGITEFVPISSSGHLILIPWIAKIELDLLSSLTFTVALHFGTGIAVLGSMGSSYIHLIQNTLVKNPSRQHSQNKLVAIIVSTAMVGALGILAEDAAESLLRDPLIVSLSLISGGILLYLADKLCPIRHSIGLISMVVIGISQSIALIPGVSRSGITMTVSRICGLDRTEATTFSFQLMGPIIIGAAVWRGIGLVDNGLSLESIALIFVSASAAGLAGAVSARWLIKHVQSLGFGIFAIYRIAVGILGLSVYLLT